MAREFFKNLPDTSTPLNASRLNGLLNGNEAMGSIVVDDIKSSNLFDKYLYSYDYVKANDIGGVTYYYTAKIYLGEPNTEYYLHTEYINGYSSVGVSNMYVLLLSEIGGDWVAIGHMSGGAIDGVLTSDSDGYVYIQIHKNLSKANYENLIKNSNIQIKKGSTLTPYTPYKNFEGKVYIKTGQETSTNEYDEGDRVYVKRVNCGYLNNGTKTIAHSIENIKNIVRYVGKFKNENTGTLFNIPRSHPSNPSAYNVDCDISKTNINITGGTAYNGTIFIAYIDIYYTKN